MVVVFDLDGTLIDSDTALVEPFLTLGVPREEISFGHPIEVECRRLGIEVDDYVDAYDTSVAQPFPGVSDLIAAMRSWSICSNKAARSGRAELARLGWTPEVVWFADDFGGEAKALGPMLTELGATGPEVMFVGDTAHDHACAEAVGARFAWAGWNPRTRAASPDGLVLRRPLDLLDHIV